MGPSRSQATAPSTGVRRRVRKAHARRGAEDRSQGARASAIRAKPSSDQHQESGARAHRREGLKVRAPSQPPHLEVLRPRASGKRPPPADLPAAQNSGALDGRHEFPHPPRWQAKTKIRPWSSSSARPRMVYLADANSPPRSRTAGRRLRAARTAIPPVRGLTPPPRHGRRAWPPWLPAYLYLPAPASRRSARGAARGERTCPPSTRRRQLWLTSSTSASDAPRRKTRNSILEQRRRSLLTAD
jgi:hypothetical protein